jgi:hypothetical protein
VTGEFIALDPIRQPGGKLVYAWAVAGDFDPAELRSNTFSMEWPPRSGRQASFPEIDRAAWFGLDEARSRILIGQVGFLDALAPAGGPDRRRRNGAAGRRATSRKFIPVLRFHSLHGWRIRHPGILKSRPPTLAPTVGCAHGIFRSNVSHWYGACLAIDGRVAAELMSFQPGGQTRSIGKEHAHGSDNHCDGSRTDRRDRVVDSARRMTKLSNDAQALTSRARMPSKTVSTPPSER